MAENVILIERRDHIGVITINRPEVRNALSLEAWRLLHAAFSELDTDNNIRAIIITGAGDKAFVAGADLNALKTRSAAETFESETAKIVIALENVGKPTIAMINGFCLGGGLEVAMGCDIRIASDDAKLGQTEINVGILPGCGGTQRLSRLVGLAKAKELVFTGKIIGAQEAERIGLVNMVVKKESLLDETTAMAKAITEKSPLTLKVAKLVMNKGFETDLGSALNLERLGQTFIFGTQDHLEGINAFLEKRVPAFKGC